MGYDIVPSLVISLFLTILFELCVALICGIRERKDLGLLLLVNLLTNPAVVLTYHILTYYTQVNRIAITIVLEMTAIFTEGYCFRVYGRTYRHPILFAFGVNLFSYGIGRVIQLFLG